MPHLPFLNAEDGDHVQKWHLLENASAAFLSAVRREMPAIRRTVGATALDPTLLTAAERLQYEVSTAE